MVALVATASMVTSAPLSPSSSARRSILRQAQDEEGRDGGGLAGPFGHGILAQHEAARGGEGRDEVKGRFACAAVMAAPGVLAIDGDEFRAVWPGLFDPGRE